MIDHSFTDANGVSYKIRVTFRTIFNVADKTGIDLLNPNQMEDGLTLEERLLCRPGTITKAVAALCEVEDQDSFYDAIDGKAFKEMEKAFWDSYLDFFVQSGRVYIATALKVDLKAREEGERQTEEYYQELLKKNSSNLSLSPESEETGKIEPYGKSTD